MIIELVLLKSGAISAVLFGYYWLFLRNRRFHQWNRGFLLATVLLAVVMPLMPLPALFVWSAEAPGWRSVLHTVVPGNWKEGLGAGAPAFVAAGGMDWSGWIYWGYGLVAAWLGFVFLRELGFITRLYRRYPRERMGDILFLQTREPGTPFSFLKMIFWNVEIDTESAEGRQMLRHELVHIRQRHTLDLLLLRPLMVVFWFNPIFYWIYRELRTIHEFEADAAALDRGDRYAYAELLVRQTLESRQRGLFHPFFSSSIKRRITMITQFSSVTPGRLSRWMVAPLAVLLLCAFSGRVHRAPGKPITVVIDAGHGGVDNGAVASGGLKEKDINLSLALKVKQLAAAYGINVVLSRDGDILPGGGKSIQRSLHYRADIAAAKKADLFISLHTDASSGAGQPGFHIYVSKENLYFQQSARLGGVLIDAMKPSYTVGDELKENAGHVWVLRAATVPAVLILCGNIDNEQDREFISNDANQEKIARDILQGVVNYGGPAAR
jgi:N-acetylmuramoyl-L-alanine amidase